LFRTRHGASYPGHGRRRCSSNAITIEIAVPESGTLDPRLCPVQSLILAAVRSDFNSNLAAITVEKVETVDEGVLLAPICSTP